MLARYRLSKSAGNNGVSYSLRGNGSSAGSGDHYGIQLLRSAMARPITDASAGDVLSVLERIQNDSFGKKLLDYTEAGGLRPARVYKTEGVERRLYSRITTDFLYKPSKDTCVAFAIALRLSLEDAADLLSRAGYMLSHASKRDLILEWPLKRLPFKSG